MLYAKLIAMKFIIYQKMASLSQRRISAPKVHLPKHLLNHNTGACLPQLMSKRYEGIKDDIGGILSVAAFFQTNKLMQYGNGGSYAQDFCQR
jgi:hypothetical protein